MKKGILLAAIAGAMMASAASAQTITTLFGGNNGGGVGGGVYFDVTVGANALNILSFEVNSSSAAGTAIAFEVYTRAGTASGFENSNAGWTLVATGSGTTAGVELPSMVTLDAPFTMGSGLSGMAISLGTAAHRYTNGNGSNQNYSDGNITLDLGQANNSLFGAGLFSPRVWNGSITYSVVPAPASMALIGLGGLVAVRRRR